jgi:hypothetical protein
MRKSLCALVLAVAGMSLGAPPAQADSPRCVSRAEYHRVHRGMSRAAVHGVFDTRGRRRAFSRVGRFTSEIRVYRGCPRRSVVSVSFARGRLGNKAARFR